jgi:phosphopantetheine--protein transferase-like protein
MDHITACGIDIEEQARFIKHLPSEAGIPEFCRMIYTEAEIEQNSSLLPQLTFPLGFSCKEAFFKAIGRGWTNSELSWKDIEVFFNNEGDLHDHSIRLNGYALELFHQKKYRWTETHLDFTDDYVIFEVILL